MAYYNVFKFTDTYYFKCMPQLDVYWNVMLQFV